jgi:hypothetical protein
MRPRGPFLGNSHAAPAKGATQNCKNDYASAHSSNVMALAASSRVRGDLQVKPAAICMQATLLGFCDFGRA